MSQKIKYIVKTISTQIFLYNIAYFGRKYKCFAILVRQRNPFGIIVLKRFFVVSFFFIAGYTRLMSLSVWKKRNKSTTE